MTTIAQPRSPVRFHFGGSEPNSPEIQRNEIEEQQTTVTRESMRHIRTISFHDESGETSTLTANSPSPNKLQQHHTRSDTADENAFHSPIPIVSPDEEEITAEEEDEQQTEENWQNFAVKSENSTIQQHTIPNGQAVQANSQSQTDSSHSQLVVAITPLVTLEYHDSAPLINVTISHSSSNSTASTTAVSSSGSVIPANSTVPESAVPSTVNSTVVAASSATNAATEELFSITRWGEVRKVDQSKEGREKEARKKKGNIDRKIAGYQHPISVRLACFFLRLYFVPVFVSHFA